MTLAEQLVALRRARGLTQTEVARAAGLSGNAVISRLERGSLLPSPRLQEKLGKVYGLPLAVLRDRVDAEATGAQEQSVLDAVDDEVQRLRAVLHAETEKLVAELGHARARLAETLLASRVQLMWSREQKIAHEAAAKTIWVVSPDLRLDVGPLRPIVAANLARGAQYRYLLPALPEVRRRATALQRLGGDLEVRFTPPDRWRFVLEVVLYDVRSPKRRLGLMVAPSARAETDCVLSPAHVLRFARDFDRAWLSKSSR